MDMVIWSEHQFVRKNESKAVEVCYQFLVKVDMQYLRSRLNYDVRSEFGNFRVLIDLWLKVFNGDHVRLIEFYERAYDDRDIPRHESLMEVFLVTLAASILGEEYKARRKAIGSALLNLRRKCILSLQYLLDMDALKYLKVNQIIDHQEYTKLSRQLKKRLLQKRAMPRGIARKARPYYRAFGMSSSSDVLRGLERTTSQRSRSISQTQTTIPIPKGAVTIVGLAASPGAAHGKIKVIRSPEEAVNVTEGDIGVFCMFTPEMVFALEKCAGIIGTRDASGMTGHLAVAARGMKKPAVVSVDNELLILSDGKFAIVDGNLGKVHLVC